jgi:hypothetical protein
VYVVLLSQGETLAKERLTKEEDLWGQTFFTTQIVTKCD